MRYILGHITTISQTYNGSVPLAHFLKAYFKQYPILGSRDRKLLSAMAYSWYRFSKGVGNDELLHGLMAQWLQEKEKGDNDLAAWLQKEIPSADFNSNALCPHDIPISDGITRAQWLGAMLAQPNLFIRIRKDKVKAISLLNNAQIPHTFITDNCLSLPNGAKIDTALPEDMYVVQDASSQRTGEFFHPKKNEQWYDCCAGAGGKSLLLKDMAPGVRLTVTDKRESIIHNLQQRFRQYRHELPVAHIADVADAAQLTKALGGKQFDTIICDAPCSGSGTWARTPEQLYFFKPDALAAFAALQQTIAINVCRHIKPGGRLLYITCSVFRQENEMVVADILKQTNLQLMRSQVINGVDIFADSMFIAELILP